MNSWVKWNVLAATQTTMTNSSQVSFALTPSMTSAQDYVWFRSIDYSLQLGNLTTAPELDLDFIEPLRDGVNTIPKHYGQRGPGSCSH